MKLTFIRADHEVTGSCTLLEIGGHYGLIDCGMEQGRDLFEYVRHGQRFLHQSIRL